MYDAQLSKYRGQTLRVTGSQMRSRDDVVVNAEVVNPNQSDAQRIKVAFRVRNSGSGLTVTDMQVEGVWLAISERADFESYLQRNGNSVARLRITASSSPASIQISLVGGLRLGPPGKCFSRQSETIACRCRSNGPIDGRDLRARARGAVP